MTRLPDETSIGFVHLRVSNLQRAAEFYHDVIGLAEIRRTAATAMMSSRGTPPAQLLLTEDPSAHPRNPFSPGLFHVAWKVGDRASLAGMIRHLAAAGVRLQGFADHGVSEAVYLADPEGNGIEVYRDRPKEEWPMSDGRIAMMTDPLDLDGLLKEPGESGAEFLDPRMSIGHVHLQVSDLGRARTFYHDMLGFDVTQDSYPGALFVSAGGYHHHIGLNTWNSLGRVRPNTAATGLVSYGIVLPDAEALAALRTRLEEQGMLTAPSPDGSFSLRDSDDLHIKLLHPAVVSSNTITV